jgi:hypothetical protein
MIREQLHSKARTGKNLPLVICGERKGLRVASSWQ